jgi:hypothetical protein
MVTLRQKSNGAFAAKKRIPDDVRDEYRQLHGQYHVAKFYAPPGTKPHEAKRLFGEWLAEVEGHIANIRAQRTGEGVSLTREQARALAGEWYAWFLARHASGDMDPQWARDQVQDAMRKAVGEKRWEANHPDELWDQEEELRCAVRPILADVGETAQFLATKSLVLNNAARDLFLDFFYWDLAAALKRLIANAKGDYSPDRYSEKFPKAAGSDSGDKPTQLFERWAKEREAAAGTVENWRYFFRKMEEHFKDRSAASITPTEAQQWIKGLISPTRKARTVHNTWLRASRTIFNWAVDHGLIPSNPFANVKITVPKQIRLRETQAFYAEEQRLILTAALKVADIGLFHAGSLIWLG